ncbi:MAG: DUF2325 domain-containing protein [Dethiobacter sp.]|jgi:hypothetical protein|nr:DUF2325 domain-containing protein [Dethiobacter sp.]
MTVLLVGADRLGNIPKELEQYGCEKIIHWDGRKVQDKKIPKQVDMVLMFYDYLGHALMADIKSQAKKRNLPVVFSRRGTADLKKALDYHSLG